MRWIEADEKELAGSLFHAGNLGWWGDRGVEHGPTQQLCEARETLYPQL